MRSPQNHLWRGVDLRALVNSGHTNREIAEMVGATSGHVRVAINRAGLNSVIPIDTGGFSVSGSLPRIHRK